MCGWSGWGVSTQGDLVSCPAMDGDLQGTLYAPFPRGGPHAAQWLGLGLFYLVLAMGGRRGRDRSPSYRRGPGAPTLASLALCGAALLLMCLSSSDPALSWAP